MADSYLYPGSCGSRMGNGNDRGDVMPHSDIYWELWDGPSSSGREKQRSSKRRTSLLYRSLVVDTRWYIPAEDRRLEAVVTSVARSTFGEGRSDIDHPL